MTKNEVIIFKIKEWLECNIEELSLPYEVREDNDRLLKIIKKWENE
tara:strand:+ start:597 stop:734 length:138 start_codon:yes stop_codon:yes gene_type:complete